MLDVQNVRFPLAEHLIDHPPGELCVQESYQTDAAYWTNIYTLVYIPVYIPRGLNILYIYIYMCKS